MVTQKNDLKQNRKRGEKTDKINSYWQGGRFKPNHKEITLKTNGLNISIKQERLSPWREMQDATTRYRKICVTDFDRLKPEDGRTDHADNKRKLVWLQLSVNIKGDFRERSITRNADLS